MNSNQDKVYKRKFENYTSKQLTALIRRSRQRKYGLREKWIEVEETPEGKFSGIFFYTL